ncbi:MAG: hypothetical protein EAZ97_15605, partial [Bacteroidetes bacterium]
EKWLSEGNQIDVWAVPFQSWKVQKLVYVLVFTPKNISNRNLLKAFDNEKFEHFSFSSAFDKGLEKRNYRQYHGGLQNIEAVDFVDRFAWNFEFYNLHQTDLEKNMAKDKVFLKNIFLEIDTNFVQGIQTSIKTWDIRQIYEQYHQSLEESSSAIKIDQETKDTFLLSAPDIAFRFTGGVLDNHLLALQTDTISGELGIKLQEIPKEKRLLYVEIYLENAQFVPNKKLKDALSYKHEQGFLMTSLYESIHLAMKKLYYLREKKVLKTYYIQLLD